MSFIDDNVARTEGLSNSVLDKLESDSNLLNSDLFDLKVLVKFFVDNKRVSMSKAFRKLYDYVIDTEKVIVSDGLNDKSSMFLLNIGKLYTILYPYSEVLEASVNSDFVFMHFDILSPLSSLKGYSEEKLSKRSGLSEEDVSEILLSGIKRGIVLKYDNGTYGLTKKGCDAHSFVMRNMDLFELCKGSVK